MASQFQLHSPSSKTLLLAKLGIVWVVIVTGLVSVTLVRSQLERHQIQPEQIPIAELRIWNSLGR